MVCVCVCVQREEMINDGGGLEREMFFSRVFWEAVQTQGDQVPADRVSWGLDKLIYVDVLAHCVKMVNPQ